MVAAIVGTALNAINQGPELLGGGWPNVWKMGLTYVVPFLVASYGSYAAFRQQDWSAVEYSRRSLSSRAMKP